MLSKLLICKILDVTHVTKKSDSGYNHYWLANPAVICGKYETLAKVPFCHSRRDSELESVRLHTENYGCPIETFGHDKTFARPSVLK